MVTEAVVSVLAGFFTWVLGTFPTLDTPTWLTDAGVYVSQGASFVGDMGHVLPVPAMVAGLGLVVLVWGFTLAVRVIRMLLSLFTGGGGSAA